MGGYENAALTLACTLAAGVTAQSVARHLDVPGIIILLVVGILLGPDVLGIIDPATLGPMTQVIVGFAVAVILFEGGLHLHLKRLRSQAKILRRLLTIGAFVTALGGALAAYLILDWSWQISFLFGSLIIVTGPTVVTPLLRRIGIKENLATILEAEGVLIDPIGAIFAVVALEVVLAAGAASLPVATLDLFSKLGVGFLIGLVGGYLIGLLLRSERFVPNELENIFTLALVLFLFEASNFLLRESGIMTVTVAGMVVGNMRLPTERRLVDFKEQLTTMLIGVLFVLLAADVRMSQVAALGWQGFLVIIVVMVVVRPLNIGVCAMNTPLTSRERLFMSWLAPRGIVAAAVASLFAADLQAAGVAGGDSLKALVFGVIGITVISQGLTAAPLARLLSLKRESGQGYIVVGSNPLGIALAKALRADGNEIIVLDNDNMDLALAADQGFETVYGSGLEESTLLRAHADSRKGVVVATPNEGINLIIAGVVQELRRDPPRGLVLLKKGTHAVEASLHRNDLLLFGQLIDYELWAYRFNNKAVAYHELTIQARGTLDWPAILALIEGAADQVLPFVVRSKGQTSPIVAHHVYDAGDIIVLAAPTFANPAIFESLREVIERPLEKVPKA